MLLIVEILMFIAGVVFLIRGKVQFGSRKVVTGRLARKIAVWLCIPLPIFLGIALGLASIGAGGLTNGLLILTAIEIFSVIAILIGTWRIYRNAPDSNPASTNPV
jgi:uncharacterized membrane protein